MFIISLSKFINNQYLYRNYTRSTETTVEEEELSYSCKRGCYIKHNSYFIILKNPYQKWMTKRTSQIIAVVRTSQTTTASCVGRAAASHRVACPASPDWRTLYLTTCPSSKACLPSHMCGDLEAACMTSRHSKLISHMSGRSCFRASTCLQNYGSVHSLIICELVTTRIRIKKIFVLLPSLINIGLAQKY